MRLILLFLLVSWPAISIAAPKQTPHWSYVKPQRPSFPETRSANWVQNEIDYFVLHRLESEGLSPSPTGRQNDVDPSSDPGPDRPSTYATGN